MIGIALPIVTAPDTDSICKIPTEADELCIIAVNTAPVITPKIGFLNRRKTITEFFCLSKRFY